MMGSMMQDLAFAIPGVDEAMSFAEIMKYVAPSTSTSPPRVEPFSVKTRKVHGVLGHRVRYGTNRAHPPLPLLPHGA